MLKRIYNYADIFHCEPIEKVADDVIQRCVIPVASYDNVKKCKYEVPDYWTMGEVYERLIEDIIGEQEERLIPTVIEVYTSWISDALSNYNSDLYYQSREYIFECYKEGKICVC